MEGDSISKREKDNQTESCNCCSSDSDTPEPIRFRRRFLYCDEINKFLLGDVWYLLPGISLLFWALLLVAS